MLGHKASLPAGQRLTRDLKTSPPLRKAAGAADNGPIPSRKTRANTSSYVRCVNIASPECLTNADNDSDRECETSMPAYDIFTISTGQSLSAVKRIVRVNGRELEILCDTGAELNVLPSHCMPDLSLEKAAHVSISAWGNFQLPVLGSALCSVSYDSRTVDDTFYIIESTSSRTLPLFTYDLCRKLGIIAELASIGESVVDVHCILDKHRCLLSRRVC